MPADEVAPGAEHGAEVIPAALHEVGQRGEQVERRARDGHAKPLCGRGALVKHGEIVPVIVEDLGRRIGLERAAAQVVDPAPGHDPHPVTRQLHPPAEVDLLHVGEEIAVEAAQRAEHVGPAAESRAAHPEHVALVVVLAPVLLHAAQDAPPAEGIAQVVDETARSPRILELRAVGAGDQLRRGDRHVGIPVQTVENRRKPPLGGLDIGVQQQVIVGLDILQCAVVASGKAVVAVHAQDRDRRKPGGERRERVVRRTVVGDDDLDAGGSRGHDRRQETTQVVRAVPVEYDDFSDRHEFVCASSGDATTSTVRDTRRSSAPTYERNAA